MRVSQEEMLAIRQVVNYGHKYGFGNLMSHLQSAWASYLMDEYDMDEEAALNQSAGRIGMPVKMHRDILLRGEWDETGERYK